MKDHVGEGLTDEGSARALLKSFDGYSRHVLILSFHVDYDYDL